MMKGQHTTLLRTSSAQPPLHPLELHPLAAVQQLTSCWGERARLLTEAPPTLIRYMLSIAAVTAKAQQEPHWYWLRIGVTLPAVTQLTVVAPGGTAVEKNFVEASSSDTELGAVGAEFDMRYWSENCWLLRWKNRLPLALRA